MIAKAVLVAAALAAACSAAATQRSRSVPAAPVVSDFGACAARRMPDQGRALLATPLDSRAEQRAARRMAESRSACVAARFNSISMRTGEFRGGVAEGLIEADPAALARLRARPQSPPVRAEARQGRAFVAAYARCLADADSARAAGLLELVPGSPEERAAFLGFGALLEECMPIGLTYAIDTFDVRNHIALRLYELAFLAAPRATD
jgi:hypothetical protein